MIGQLLLLQGGGFMWVLWVISAVISLIIILFKFGVVLHKKGYLIPMLVAYAGFFGVMFLWSRESIGAKIFAVPLGMGAIALFMWLAVKAKGNKHPVWKVNLSIINMCAIAGIFWAINIFTSKETNDRFPAVLLLLFSVAIIVCALTYGFKKLSKTDKLPKVESKTANGVVFGKIGRKYITKPENEDGHILVCGGVGSGKTSCIAIPTLRVWKDCAFVIDIKGELYENTKNHRENIKVFNPLDESSYGYDPFYCLYNSDNPAQEARAIAQAIIPLPPNTKEPFWIESAQSILTGAILYCLPQNLSFLEVLQAIQNEPPKVVIEGISESDVVEARYCVNSFVDIDDKTLSGIMAELSKNILPFVTDKNLISALSREQNITPEDLERGYDVYIQIPEHLLRQWKTLLTLTVNQFLTHFEKREERNAEPILFMLDEFPRLGKINAMLDGLATLRSKKITMCLIIQSLAQLDMIYGKNERKVICDTCSYKAVLGASDTETQKYFSDLVGTYEKLVTSKGKSVTGLMNYGESTNMQPQDKPIIKPHEFGMLDYIVLLTPHKMPFKMPNTNDCYACFCRVEKMPYYLDEE
jgi:type IV secretion system protein VirD4